MENVRDFSDSQEAALSANFAQETIENYYSALELHAAMLGESGNEALEQAISDAFEEFEQLEYRSKRYRMEFVVKSAGSDRPLTVYKTTPDGRIEECGRLSEGETFTGRLINNAPFILIVPQNDTHESQDECTEFITLPMNSIGFEFEIVAVTGSSYRPTWAVRKEKLGDNLTRNF